MLFNQCILTFVMLFAYSSVFAKEKYNFSSLKPHQFVVFDGKKYSPFDTFDYKGLKVNSKCGTNAKVNPKCLALAATKTDLPDKNSNFNGSPASELCTTLKGVNIIAFDNTGGEQNFCKFSDDSLINSWTMYYHYFPKSEIK